MKQACMVCKQKEVHVNYEFDFPKGSGFCGAACEKKYFNAVADKMYEREYDDMFADHMELDPSDRI